MQCLCIGSDGNDDDNTDDDGKQTHDHHRPHLEASLSVQKTKKQQLMHCCGTAPFVFFYE